MACVMNATGCKARFVCLRCLVYWLLVIHARSGGRRGWTLVCVFFLMFWLGFDFVWYSFGVFFLLFFFRFFRFGGIHDAIISKEGTSTGFTAAASSF